MKPPRCRVGLKMTGEQNFSTRCRQKPGHNGPHVGPHLPELPYQLIRWFHGDAREFLTDRDLPYAWKNRGKVA
jgi:hypothetical protein